MEHPYLLEVAANSVASAIAAQNGGAGRVELCTGLELGGLTPSTAQIAMAREQLRIPLYVLIRPRAGDFLYSDLECETMRRDIETCEALGCDGVVLGMLDPAGRVDVARCKTLMRAAGRMGVTFHRAFDLAQDQEQALEDLITLGVERVLTSGPQPSAPEGASLIRKLVAQGQGLISIMPGAGINAGNIAALAETTGASEFHASAKMKLPSGMSYSRPALSDMEGGEVRSDEREIRELVAALRR
jgi:copper homeostasis protein